MGLLMWASIGVRVGEASLAAPRVNGGGEGKESLSSSADI